MTVKSVNAVIVEVPGFEPSLYNFRRIQVTEQQAEKQRKNVLQKCLVFHERALQLAKDRGW